MPDTATNIIDRGKKFILRGSVSLKSYHKSLELHRKINVDWLCENGFISLGDSLMTKEFKLLVHSLNRRYRSAFLGEHNQNS